LIKNFFFKIGGTPEAIGPGMFLQIKNEKNWKKSEKNWKKFGKNLKNWKNWKKFGKNLKNWKNRKQSKKLKKEALLSIQWLKPKKSFCSERQGRSVPGSIQFNLHFLQVYTFCIFEILRDGFKCRSESLDSATCATAFSANAASHVSQNKAEGQKDESDQISLKWAIRDAIK
jgi:hypothetical protein